MSSDDTSVQSWIDRGKAAYWQMNLAEAFVHFEKAVAADPQSIEAQLCYGAVCLFQYQNGIAGAIPQFLLDPSGEPWPEEDMKTEVQRIRDLITHENATNGKRAEEHLWRAVHLDPRNVLATEYLAQLFFAWSDNGTDGWGGTRQSRLPEAKHWYQRILEIDPQHKFAHYVCGVIDWTRAFEVVQSSGSYPRPLPSEEARQSLHSHVALLLDQAVRNLSRSAEIDPGAWRPMSYLVQVMRLQAYVAATEDEAALASSGAEDLTRWVNRILEPQSKSGANGTVTFDRVLQTSKPRFPPDPRSMIPLGLPLPRPKA